MIRAIVVQDSKVLMVKQIVERGDTVWHFPGGGIEHGETPEQACIREVKEETGLEVEAVRLVYESGRRLVFECRVTGGQLFTNPFVETNGEILAVEWVPIEDEARLDEVTRPIAEAYRRLSTPVRPRVCAAIIRDQHILMVYHDHGSRCFWTLPGGGIEEGETLEQAAVREVMEEVRLNGVVERMLYESSYSLGPETCFLVRVDAHEEAQLGTDPEYAAGEQILKHVAWFPLEQVKDDMQVSLVLQSLAQAAR